MSDKRKDKAEIESLRLEIEYKISHIAEYASRAISRGVTDKDLAYLEEFDSKMKLETELFKQLCKKYMLIYREAPQEIKFN